MWMVSRVHPFRGSCITDLGPNAVGFLRWVKNLRNSSSDVLCTAATHRYTFIMVAFGVLIFILLDVTLYGYISPIDLFFFAIFFLVFGGFFFRLNFRPHSGFSGNLGSRPSTPGFRTCRQPRGRQGDFHRHRSPLTIMRRLSRRTTHGLASERLCGYTNRFGEPYFLMTQPLHWRVRLAPCFFCVQYVVTPFNAIGFLGLGILSSRHVILGTRTSL